jgi:hypothetical protein
MKLHLFLFLVFMLFVHGCANRHMNKLLIKSYPNQFEYIKYNNGRDVETVTIKKGDYLYDELYKVISDEKIRWRRSYITYAPQNLLHSEKMGINVLDGLVIINFTPDGKKWMQIVTKTEKPIISDKNIKSKDNK